MDWDDTGTISNQVIKTEKLSQNIIEGIGDLNPWSVNDASVFLRYCCPECDFSDQKLEKFTTHAVICHEKSKILFPPTEEDGKVKSESKK